jgi:hypothetical protein
MNIAAKAIELGYCHRTPQPAGFGECRGKLGAAIERVGALACLNLHEHAAQLKALCRGEANESFPLRLNPEPRSALL